jgi:hypothetical protein
MSYEQPSLFGSDQPLAPQPEQTPNPLKQQWAQMHIDRARESLARAAHLFNDRRTD